MKAESIIPLIALTFAFFTSCRQDLPDTHVKFNDKNFLNALIEMGVDLTRDSIISLEEAEAVRLVNISGKNISDLTGIEKFINLEILHCLNNRLNIVDLTSNMALKQLNLNNNQLVFLDVSQNVHLETLYCNQNQLRGIDTGSADLVEIICNDNQIQSLDLSGNTSLEKLECENNQITSLNVSNNPQLVYLNCRQN